MRTLLLLASILAGSSAPADRARPDAINTVLGDASWLAAHGETPRGAPDVERIRTHLLFVEARLRAVTPPDMGASARARRARLLDVLHAYADAGVFPQHDAGSGITARTPRFVDREGRICAVGHLVATTEGRAVAERIGAQHEYETIAEMDEPLLDAWANEHGLKRAELAMIQPAYAPPPPPRDRRVGITWNVRALMPIVACGVEMSDGNRLTFEPAGGGAEAGLGYELGHGVALMLSGGLTAHDAHASGVLTTVRTGLGALWTIEAGPDWIAPQIGLSAGLLLAATERTGIAATGYGSALVGARLRPLEWLAIDVTLALEGALPGAAFTDGVAWVTPSIALSLGESRPSYPSG
jgi:hypothetical protein